MRSLALALCLFPMSGQADIIARFIESAPKDRFEITNTGCDLGAFELTINLATAPAGVIFDVTSGGAGVEVYQPVEVVSGPVSLSEVTDGDQLLTLQISGFGTGQKVVVSADLDDLQTSSTMGQIRVSGSEIAGATLSSAEGIAAFSTTSEARLPMPGCLG